MRYPEAISYLNSFPNYEKNTNYSYRKDLKLARLRGLLALLGNPQNSLRVIHVAGTKGKGSTCVFAAYILRAAGFRAGLYTSPHLKDFRERIRILRPSMRLVSLRGAVGDEAIFDDEIASPRQGGARNDARDFEGMISKAALVSLVKELKPIIDKYNRALQYGTLTFFEVYTALAFLYFKRQRVDFAVLETGLGGRLDATNTAWPLVCGITPISLEHVDKLGNTLSKIAAEKAGIIKHPGVIVISAAQAKPAQNIIYQRCKKFQAKLYTVGKEIKYFNSKNGLVIKGFKNEYRNLRLRLLGAHQLANAALAVGLIEGLSFHGFNFKDASIRRGIARAAWPGRCEVTGKNPLVVLDGAQNLASAKVLKKALKENFKYRKLILVLGISADKDIEGICKTLGPLADEIILTRAASLRAAPPARLAKYFKRRTYLTASVKEAKLLAKSLADREDLILVTGSLFVVGEFRDAKK